MKVSAQYAQEHFADLLNAASSGEEVEIALAGKPALLLAPRLAPRLAGRKGTPSGRPRAELLGAGEGLVTLPTDEEWRAMDKEIENEMLNGPIFPPEHP
jgi:antitoxin (DNA-binding transcriptional repressor) of toxin-antitoxin stability system